MPYNKDMNWNEWVWAVGNLGKSIIDILAYGDQLQQKYYNATYGMTSEQKQAKFGKSADDITALEYALGSIKEMHDVLTNVAVGQADRQGYIVPFI